MTTWTAPRTWTTEELVTASIMNTHIRDNLLALKAPPTDSYKLDELSDYTTTSTSFVDIDGTNLSLTITTTGGDVLVGFSGAVSNDTATKVVWLDVDMDGVRLGADDGILVVTASTANAGMNGAFIWLVTGLSAGSHTFKLQWKVSSGSTGKMWAGAGTTGGDMHPQFWVREVS